MEYDIFDPTQVDLTSNFFVLFINMKVSSAHLNYSKWMEPSINIMKERVNVKNKALSGFER